MNPIPNLRIIRVALNACVDEMFPMDKGIIIEYPNEEVFRIGDVRTTRKQIKHVIEQRKTDGKSIDEVKKIFAYLPIAIADSDFEILNPNQTYSESVMRVKMFKGWRHGIAIVLDKEINDWRDFITAYPQRPISAYFLLLKKLNTSTAGKTPHPKDLPGG